jgi:26S proteasome non-ATPase regulatory subunit 9
MSRIETGLHEHHAALQQAEASQPSSQTVDSRTTSGSVINEAQEATFAKVNSVVEGSPAAQAGLVVGDRIRRFDHVNWMNHDNLSKVAEVVRRNEGVCRLPFSIGLCC